MGETAGQVPFEAPPGLGERGTRLWGQFGGSSMQDHASRTVLEEACRTADRLEGLNDVIAGKGVLALMHFRSMIETDSKDERHITLTVDGALSEARQQQANLQRMLAAVVPVAADAGGVKPSADPLDELTERREREGRPAPPRRART